MTQSSRNIMYAGILITLSLLLYTAGCVDSSQKNSPPANTTRNACVNMFCRGKCLHG